MLGLAFKPNTDDMRDAPSIPLINALVERGAEVSAFDPVAREQAEKIFTGIEFASDAYAAAADADALVIVTEWDEFRALDLDKIAGALSGKVLVDLRNVYDRDEAEQAGLAFYGVGRGQLESPDAPARSRASSGTPAARITRPPRSSRRAPWSSRCARPAIAPPMASGRRRSPSPSSLRAQGR